MLDEQKDASLVWLDNKVSARTHKYLTLNRMLIVGYAQWTRRCSERRASRVCSFLFQNGREMFCTSNNYYYWLKSTNPRGFDKFWQGCGIAEDDLRFLKSGNLGRYHWSLVRRKKFLNSFNFFSECPLEFSEKFPKNQLCHFWKAIMCLQKLWEHLHKLFQNPDRLYLKFWSYHSSIIFKNPFSEKYVEFSETFPKINFRKLEKFSLTKN